MGSLVAPVVDPGPDKAGIDPWPTEANAKANSAVSAAADIIPLNQTALTIYQNQWSMWAAQVVGGYAHEPTPPQPPPAWVVVVGAEGYSSPGVGTVPICKLPPTPAGPLAPVVPVVNTVSVGIQVAGNPGWFDVGPTDGAPNGYVTSAATMSADGVPGPFRRFYSPFGGAVGWYEKL